MTKVSKLITIDPELNERLKKEYNASGLISTLLWQYYRIQKEYDTIDKEREAKLETAERERQKQLKDKMDRLSEFINSMSDAQREDFLEGRKSKKWSGMTEYAELKMKEND